MDSLAYNGTQFNESFTGFNHLLNPMCTGVEGYIEMCDAESWAMTLPCGRKAYAEVDCNLVDAGKALFTPLGNISDIRIILFI